MSKPTVIAGSSLAMGRTLDRIETVPRKASHGPWLTFFNVNGIAIVAKEHGWSVATHDRVFATLDEAKAYCASVVHKKKRSNIRSLKSEST